MLGSANNGLTFFPIILACDHSRLIQSEVSARRDRISTKCWAASTARSTCGLMSPPPMLFRSRHDLMPAHSSRRSNASANSRASAREYEMKILSLGPSIWQTFRHQQCERKSYVSMGQVKICFSRQGARECQHPPPPIQPGDRRGRELTGDYVWSTAEAKAPAPAVATTPPLMLDRGGALRLLRVHFFNLNSAVAEVRADLGEEALEGRRTGACQIARQRLRALQHLPVDVLKPLAVPRLDPRLRVRELSD